MCGVGSRAWPRSMPAAATAQVRAARDFLLNHREDYATAYRDYRSPVLEEFNWALDWFDAIARDGGDRPALWIVEPDGGETGAPSRS
jgi:acetyl-CoA synthetase